MKEINDSVKIMEENKKRKGYGDSWAPWAPWAPLIGNVAITILCAAKIDRNDMVGHKERMALREEWREELKALREEERREERKALREESDKEVKIDEVMCVLGR